MPNRFTEQLDALEPRDQGGDHERIGWTDIWNINVDLYSRVSDNFRHCGEYSERTLFLAFIAELSDADLAECFNI